MGINKRYGVCALIIAFEITVLIVLMLAGGAGEAGAQTITNDIISYYRSLGSDLNVVETTDLLKAADDWSNNIAPPGFASPIKTQQLLMLADEWSRG